LNIVSKTAQPEKKKKGTPFKRRAGILWTSSLNTPEGNKPWGSVIKKSQLVLKLLAQATTQHSTVKMEWCKQKTTIPKRVQRKSKGGEKKRTQKTSKPTLSTRCTFMYEGLCEAKNNSPENKGRRQILKKSKVTMSFEATESRAQRRKMRQERKL